MRKITAIITLVAFVLTSLVPSAAAQEMLLPATQGAIGLTSAFTPCQLRGVRINPQDPLNLDFVVDSGDQQPQKTDFDAEAQKLIKYFMAVITTPEQDLWVNLSPYEQDRIIQNDFGRTAMGRDILAQDFILKQITSSLMHPDSALGKKFWAKIYQRAYEKFGTTDFPVDTFNKVWIMPARATIYENGDSGPDHQISAFLEEARLKVMLESDYLAMEQNTTTAIKAVNGKSDGSPGEYVKDIIREVMLPVLEQEINEGSNFAVLRQVYYSLILAVWLKQKLQTAVVGKDYDPKTGMVRGNMLGLIYVDQHKTSGLEMANPQAEIGSIYDNYVSAFRKGAYNFIREDYDIYSQELIPRKYFSGGVVFDHAQANIKINKWDSNKRPPKRKTGVLHWLKTTFSVVNAKNSQTGVSVNKETKSHPERVYFQSRKSGYVKALLVLSVVASLGVGIYVGSKWPKGRQAIVEPRQEIVEPQQSISLDKAKAQVKFVNPFQLNIILNSVTEALTNFHTGELHRRRGIKPDLIASTVTPDTFLIRMTAEGDTSEMSYEHLADIFNNIFSVFSMSYENVGLSRQELVEMMLHIIAKESEGFMGANQMVGPQKDIIQARGGAQFEYQTFMTLLEVAQSILNDKNANWSAGEFKDFNERVLSEMRRKLGDATRNRWVSADVKDMVVQSADQIALMMIWLNHIIVDKPEPPQAQRSLLDAKMFAKRIDLLEHPNLELSLYDVVSKVKAEGKYPMFDKESLLIAAAGFAWNGGGNMTEAQFEYALKFIFSNLKQRDALMKKAGSRAYTNSKAMTLAQNKVMAKLKALKIQSVEPNALFAIEISTRAKTTKILRQELAAKSVTEQESFKRTWMKYRAIEDTYRYWIWCLTNCPQAAKHPDYLLAVFKDSKLAYKAGFDTRENTLRYDDYAKKIISMILDERKQPLVKPVSFDLPPAPASVEDKMDLAMLSIELTTKGTSPQAIYNIVSDHAQKASLELKIGDTDPAMNEPMANTGGIDLRTNSMGLNIKGISHDLVIEMPLDQFKALKNDVKGFIPLILSVQPLDNVALFMGSGS